MSQKSLEKFCREVRVLFFVTFLPLIVVLICVFLAYIFPVLVITACALFLVYPLRNILFRWIKSACEWCFALDFTVNENDEEDKKAKTGIAELITVFIFGVTQGGVLMLSERKAIEVRIMPILFYIGSSILTFGLVIGILRARSKNTNKKIHLFNSGTIRFGRCTVGALIVVFSAIIGAAAFNATPKDPERVELEITDLEKHAFKYDKDKKVLGINVVAKITHKELARMSYVTNPTLSVIFDSDLYSEWYISAIDGTVVKDLLNVDEAGKRSDMNPAPIMVEFSKHATGKSRICMIQFHNLSPAPNETYELRLYMHPQKNNPSLSGDAESRGHSLDELKKERSKKSRDRQLRLILHPPEKLK